MKIEPFHIFILKSFGAVALAVILCILVFYMWIVVGVIDDGPDGYYTYHPQWGIIIGVNETRGVFYVEINKTVKGVHVEPYEFGLYNIRDEYRWEIAIFHRYPIITNMTMIQSW